MSHATQAMNVPTLAAGVGTSLGTTGRTGMCVEIDGTFVGTVNVELKGIGASWKVYQTVSVPSMVYLPGIAMEVRVNVTAYTSGQPIAWLHSIVGGH